MQDSSAVRATSNGRIRPVVGIVAIALLGVLVPASPASGQEGRAVKRPQLRQLWPTDAVPGSLLVTRHDRSVEQVDVAVGHEAAEAARIERQPGVVAVEPDVVRHAFKVSGDPLASQQWSHTQSNAPAAWDVTTGDPAVKVAIIDSGIDATHPDLRANVVSQVDVSSGVQTRALGTNNDPCGLGHGTFVAGVVGAVGDNGIGVAGVAWHVSIVDVAAGDPNRCGAFDDSAIVTGIQYAVSQGVDVINLSLGGPGGTCPTAYQSAIDEARANGVVVVAAAGNDELQFPGLTSIPASCNGVISVGAVGDSGDHSAYSNANAEVDLAAPGGDSTTGHGKILSTALGGGYDTEEGTSFASPYVVGTVALLRSVNKALTADQVESILESTASGHGVRTAALGWGRVDVGAAVARAKAGGDLPAPAPDPVFPVGLVVRVSDQSGSTGAVRQAVATSKFVFDDGRAKYAIVARKDDFADALAGSTLGFGQGPVLFTGSTGSLDPLTAVELKRILPAGGQVYLLGGTSALPATLEADVRALGLEPVRLAGTTREATAAAVATEDGKRQVALGFGAPTRVVLATARQWPDAVTAGSLGAWFGYPILLTDPNTLSPATRDALASLHPDRIYVVGGTAAVSSPVANAARDAAHATSANRLAGVDRVGTAVAVAQQFVTEFRGQTGFDPLYPVAVNLRRGDGFAHVLSASAIVGAGSGVFLPLEGNDGDTIAPAVKSLACALDPFLAVVAGEKDIVTDSAKARLDDELEHKPSACA
jgi:subtilisin family serine protease/putative cell wall-binding protein